MSSPIKWIFFICLTVFLYFQILRRSPSEHSNRISYQEKPQIQEKSEESFEFKQSDLNHGPSLISGSSDLSQISSFKNESPSSPSRKKAIEETLEDLRSDGLVYFERIDDFAVAQGDIILGELAKEQGLKKGLVEFPKILKWPSNQIPYDIDPELESPERLEKAFEIFENTSIHFKKRKNESDYLYFTSTEKNCFSYLGKKGGRQPIYLSNKCSYGSIAHEILHALGFIHEQSRTDRDRYIEINWDNVEEGYELQFATLGEDSMEFLEGIEFDYQTIMLYNPFAFSRESTEPTMISVTDDEIAPFTDQLSQGDRLKIEYNYGE